MALRRRFLAAWLAARASRATCGPAQHSSSPAPPLDTLGAGGTIIWLTVRDGQGGFPAGAGPRSPLRTSLSSRLPSVRRPSFSSRHTVGLAEADENAIFAEIDGGALEGDEEEPEFTKCEVSPSGAAALERAKAARGSLKLGGPPSTGGLDEPMLPAVVLAR